MAWTDSGTRLFASSVVQVSFSALAVLLRFIARCVILGVSGPSDWLMLFTLLVSISNTVLTGFIVSAGMGHHIADLSIEERIAYFKLTFAAILVCNACLILTKISVLYLYLHIFVITWIRNAIHAIIVLVVIYGIWMMLSNIFFCFPGAEPIWHILVPGRTTCIDGTAKRFVDAGFNLAFELVIFFLPMPVIKSLVLRPRQKLWLYFVFALGFFVCLVSIIRLRYLYDALVVEDPSLTSTQIAHWSTVEINVPIVIACIPTLKPVVVKLWPRLLLSGKTGDASSTDGVHGPYPPTISSPPIRLSSPERQHI